MNRPGLIRRPEPAVPGARSLNLSKCRRARRLPAPSGARQAGRLMRWGDFNRFTECKPGREMFLMAPLESQETLEGITFRSLALSNGTCKCDRRGRIRTVRHLRFHLSFFAWRRPSVPARIPGRVSRRSSRISSAGRVIRLPLTCCRSGIETCKSHGDDPMLQ